VKLSGELRCFRNLAGESERRGIEEPPGVRSPQSCVAFPLLHDVRYTLHPDYILAIEVENTMIRLLVGELLGLVAEKGVGLREPCLIKRRDDF